MILSGHAKSHAPGDYGVNWSALAVFQISSLGLLDVTHLILNIFDSSFSFTMTVTIPLFKKNTAINKQHMTLSSSVSVTKLLFFFLYLSF